VGGNADLVEVRKKIFRNAVVQNTLAVDDLVFLLVEGGCVVLEELNKSPRLRTFVKDLGLAFVNTAATVHNNKSLGWRQMSGVRYGVEAVP